MTSGAVEMLFDEFAAQYARGERPDVHAYLERAGKQADQLGLLIDRHLQAVPAQPPDEETVVLMHARLDHVPPLVAARTRRGLKVRELSDRLRDTLGLGEGLGAWKRRIQTPRTDRDRPCQRTSLGGSAKAARCRCAAALVRGRCLVSDAGVLPGRCRAGRRCVRCWAIEAPTARTRRGRPSFRYPRIECRPSWRPKSNPT